MELLDWMMFLANALGYPEPTKPRFITNQLRLQPPLYEKPCEMFVSYCSLWEVCVLSQLWTTALLPSWLSGFFGYDSLFPLAARKLRDQCSPPLSSVQDTVELSLCANFNPHLQIKYFLPFTFPFFCILKSIWCVCLKMTSSHYFCYEIRFK